MTDEGLIISRRRGEHLLVLTINRFERRNSFDYATACALEEELDRFDADPTLFAAILTGSGGVFSAGQDLIAASEGELAIAPRRGGFGIMQRPPDKPIIAAVEGHALAGGLELALCCDLIVASRTATMGLPEVRWSLVAAGGGLFRLPRRIPYHIAMALALTALPCSAEEMHRWGMVSRLCEPGTALEEAIDLAEVMLMNGPLALAATVQIMRRAFDMSEEQAWTYQEPFVDRVLESADRLEGLAAFGEKRAPVWTAQ